MPEQPKFSVNLSKSHVYKVINFSDTRFYYAENFFASILHFSVKTHHLQNFIKKNKKRNKKRLHVFRYSGKYIIRSKNMSNVVNNYGGGIPEIPGSRPIRRSEDEHYSPQSRVSETAEASPVKEAQDKVTCGEQPPVNINICTYGNSSCYPSFYYTSQPGGAGMYAGKMPKLSKYADAAYSSTKEEGSPAMSSHAATVPGAGGISDAQFDRLIEVLAKGKDDKKEKKVSTLTSGYIKTLENYLRSDNKDLRMMAAKDVVERFEEKDSRRDNPSLTALLNLMLQDPDSSVRAYAIAVVGGGAARGNEQTIGLLERLANSDKDRGTEATSAANALLTASANFEKVKE